VKYFFSSRELIDKPACFKSPLEMDKTVDKNYVKKYKINELLNDLYLTLTREKPDDPVSYAITHFEAKLPTKNEKVRSIRITLPFSLY
jgi:hypothetical protein